MRTKKLRILIGIMLIFVLVFSTTSTVFAAKPVSAFGINLLGFADSTSDSIVYSFEWNNVRAAYVDVYVYDLTAGGGFIGYKRVTSPRPTRNLGSGTLYVGISTDLVAGHYYQVSASLYSTKDEILLTDYDNRVYNP